MKAAPFFRKNKRGLSPDSRRRETLWGYLFILPFIIGFFAFFSYPLIESIVMSFNTVTSGVDGYNKDFTGWSNYYNLLFVSTDFRQVLVDSFLQLFTQIPVIVIFSFVAAVLINQEFIGRTFVRSVFFIPVLLTSGIIMRIESGDLLTQNLMNVGGGAGVSDSIEQMINLVRLLGSIGLSPQILDFVIGLVDGIYTITVSSGVQIIIFLSGLQAIPRTAHEAAYIDGATGWETFWKITFPLMNPLILVNVIYSIVDCFVRSTNPVMIMIQEIRIKSVNYGLASAMSWLYFLPVMLVLIVVGLLISRKVFYYD